MRLLIKWRTRSLSHKNMALVQILSILTLASKANEDLEEQLKKVKDYIHRTLNAKIASDIYNRVLVLVSEYCANEELFDKESVKISELLIQDIQLYTLVDEMLKENKYQVQHTILKGVIKRKYDETYSLNSEDKILLEYQERLLGLS
ncbi:hypothetical protein [Helicobacter cetorum]|uniref:Uncharacterized protein n=1 Tax=Helicobacter cetorum (strain ATCC BAA-540 / CCUG 52418 / MIT 99-5656) TaxID=1163745 RepID=I0ERZ7_HELCM|nr:hypothetical protein [Helicobacter cetorum]AFI05716.1 hypothetical protein HCD_03500 [Helicobacter cetorum MIT 99-5656]